jgi:hypothetical protein
MEPHNGLLASAGVLLGIGLAAGKISQLIRRKVKQHDQGR